MALCLHDAVALRPQLHARKGVYGVVDAVMARHPAAEHLAVRGIDDGVDRKGGDVAAPQTQPGIDGRWRHVIECAYARLFDHAPQQLVLRREPIGVGRNRRTRVHERAECRPQLVGIITTGIEERLEDFAHEGSKVLERRPHVLVLGYPAMTSEILRSLARHNEQGRHVEPIVVLEEERDIVDVGKELDFDLGGFSKTKTIYRQGRS
jgi:hypothetical protein